MMGEDTKVKNQVVSFSWRLDCHISLTATNLNYFGKPASMGITGITLKYVTRPPGIQSSRKDAKKANEWRTRK